MPFIIPPKTIQSFIDSGVPEKHWQQMCFDLLKRDIITRIHKEGRYSSIKTDRWNRN